MEALVLLLILLGFGFFSFPLFSYFAVIGVYSLIFLDVGIIFLDYICSFRFCFFSFKK